MILFSAAVVLCVAAFQDPTPSPSPSPSPTSTAKPSPKPAPKPSPSPTPPPTPLPSPVVAPRKAAFLDLDRVEFSPRIVRVMYSDDFEAKDQDGGAIFLRVPVAGLSQMIGLADEPIGVYFEAGMTSVSRDIIVPSGETSDPVVFAAIGADYALVDDERWGLRVQVGMAQLDFGDTIDLDAGPGLHLGLHAAVWLYDNVSLVLSPEMAMSDGNWILFNELGLSVRF